MALNPALRKMVAQAKAKYAGNAGSAIKPKEGRNVYRILAPTPDIAPWVGENGQFWADLGVHWIKAEPNGKPIAVVGDCDICYQQPSVLNAAIEMAISKALDEDSKKLYQEWRARKSVLINVIDRSTGTEEILELTPTTFGKILDLIEMYANEDVDILDPQTGCDIIITRTGKGLNTNYEVAVAPLAPGKKFEPVTKEQLARAKNLHEFIAQNYFRGEEQKALNAIAQIAGIAVPRLTAGGGGSIGAIEASPTVARTPTAALTAQSAVVEGATVEQAPSPAAAPAVDAEVAAAAARRAELLRRQQEAQRELEELERASATVAAPTATAAAPTQAVMLDQAEADAILAELDQLTNG